MGADDDWGEMGDGTLCRIIDVDPYNSDVSWHGEEQEGWELPPEEDEEMEEGENEWIEDVQLGSLPLVPVPQLPSPPEEARTSGDGCMAPKVWIYWDLDNKHPDWVHPVKMLDKLK